LPKGSILKNKKNNVQNGKEFSALILKKKGIWKEFFVLLEV